MMILDTSKSMDELLRGESLKHLAALNTMFGFESSVESANNRYWVIRRSVSTSISIDNKFDINENDKVLLFEPESETCNSGYVISKVSLENSTIALMLKEENKFKLPLSIETLALNSIISSDCKKSLIAMIDSGCEQISNIDYDIIVKMALTPQKVEVKIETIKEILGPQFLVSDELLGQICAALNCGNNLILSGPPGTGKTTIAQAAAIAARGVEPIITTATADWSTFDTVGGYMPDLLSSSPNALTFETGIILQSMIDRRWIIVDEINRAPIDKAIGQLFTVLSGGDVLLPFRNIKTGTRLKIVSDNYYSNEDIYSRSDDWRLIATMNEYDKNALFDMSYAFMRRFAIIRVGLPDNYSESVALWCQESGLDNGITYNLCSIIDNHTKQREIGPAIIKSMLAYIKARLDSGENNKLYYAESLAIFLVPQLQGLDHSVILDISNTVLEYIFDDSQSNELFSKAINTITGELL